MSLNNVILVINLGCEMLYVVDQRLNAQKVATDKSSQVLSDVTEVLMDLRFLKYITTSFKHNMLTVQQTRDLLTDIASCSIMRLDKNSMDKLWDLMVMIMKYQLYLIKHPKSLYEMTLRHLQGVEKLNLNAKVGTQIEQTRQFLFDNWNSQTDSINLTILKELKAWFKPFNTKISVLMRMGLQNADASFIDADNDFFLYYKKNIGDNIYEINLSFPPLHPKCKKSSTIGSKSSCSMLDTLSEQLNIGIEPMSPANNKPLVPLSEEPNISSKNVELSNHVEEDKTNKSNVEKLMEKLHISDMSTAFADYDDDLTDEVQLMKFFEDIKKDF